VGSRVRFPAEETLLSPPQISNRLLGPPSLLYSGYRGLYLWRLKRQWRETDQLPPSSAEVKNGGAIPPLTHMPSWRDV
jgi:hypothetical protein